MWRKLIATQPVWLTLPLRLALGVIMFAHGSQKVLGMYGGSGWSAWVSGEAPMGLRPSWLWLGAAAISEFLGGILVFFGAITRLSALAIAITMLVAICGVHMGAFFANSRGFEYPLALFAIAVALIITGGGKASIDRYLMHPRDRRR
ncbi:MAG TPA: DoxX family protein [Pyrinomonadaceae bacterium]|jgi:putative oxidoreductase|nr:DoxX family protein [Pyrinomonadaceae bacterium]